MKRLLLALSLFLLPARAEPPAYHRILFIGNSLTIAQPAPDLGWAGKWGMAASQPDKDYAHRVQLTLAARQGFIPEIITVSADLHRWSSASVDIERAAKKLQPDLVIVQMGEHTTTATPYADYLAAYRQIAAWTPNARHVATGLWGGPLTDVRGKNIERVAGETGMQYIRIRDLHTAENVASQYTNTAVAWHPNDTGHRLIAERIMSALVELAQTQSSTWLSTWLPIVAGCGSTIPPGTIPPDCN